MNEDGIEISLPKGWSVIKLSEICERITKGATPTTYGFSFVASGIRFLKIENVKNGRVLINTIKDYISDEAHGYQKKSQLQVGDLLFSIAGTIGETCVIKEDYLPANTNQAFAIIRGAEKKINLKFLQFQLESFIAKIRLKARGGAMNNVSLEDLKNFETILPPSATQRVIVSKIEELFSELDKGIENLRLAQQQLKTYRQAVLKWAFKNQNGKNFVLSQITEKIQIGPFGTQLHKEDYIENGIPLINPMHIKGGLILADKLFSISKERRDSLPNYILKDGDVIMGRRGEMGRCALVTTKENGWFCGTGSLYFRPNYSLVNSKFLFNHLKSELVRKYLEDNAGGTTMANLNLKIANNIPISLPAIQEQQKVVDYVESRLSVADKLEESITRSLQQAEALRQSILKMAFKGKLT